MVVADDRCVEQVLRLEKEALIMFELLLHTGVELYERCVPAVIFIESLNHGDAFTGIGGCDLPISSALGIFEEQ